MIHTSQELQTDLVEAFFHDTSTKYLDYFKVFYIDEATMADGGLGVAQGMANSTKNGKSCIVFREGLEDKDTAIHELLHAMGLRHSFDEENLFVFRENDTDNIMDYDEIAVGGEKKSPDKIHLWKWQIDILRENAKNNKFIRKP